jgi:hypothetical protein
VNQQKNQPAMEFFNTIGGKRSFTLLQVNDRFANKVGQAMRRIAEILSPSGRTADQQKFVD